MRRDFFVCFVLNHTPCSLLSRVLFYFSLCSRCCWRLEKSFHWSSEQGNGCQIQSVLRRNQAGSKVKIWCVLQGLRIYRIILCPDSFSFTFMKSKRNQNNTWFETFVYLCNCKPVRAVLHKQPSLIQLVYWLYQLLLNDLWFFGFTCFLKLIFVMISCYLVESRVKYICSIWTCWNHWEYIRYVRSDFPRDFLK